MTAMPSRGTVTAEEFGALCNLFDATHCDQIDPTPAQAGDILYHGANRVVCDHSRLITRAILAYLGITTGDPAGDQRIEEVRAAMLTGEGSLDEATADHPGAVTADSLEEAIESLIANEHAASEAASDEQHAVTYGDYFRVDDAAGDGGPPLTVYGYILTPDEYVAGERAAGADAGEEAEQRRHLAYAHSLGKRFSRCFSADEPGGEFGYTHVVDITEKITRDEFDAAAGRRWLPA